MAFLDELRPNGMLGSSRERFIVDSSSPFRVISGRGTPKHFPFLPFLPPAPRLMHPTSENRSSRKFVYAILLHSPGPIRAFFLS
jgi:hypothetical protein